MKHVWTIGVFVLVATVGSAQGKSLPSDVLGWYTDSMSVFGDLVTALDGASDAPATARAFRQAAQNVHVKSLADRYKILAKKYPRYFDGSRSQDWTPPSELVPTAQKYSEILSSYGQSMQKAISYASDPQVAQALEEFSSAMEAFQDE